MNFDVKIGLETHVELLTESKIFCNCKNIFSAEPNTCCCEVCMGFPGAMPRLNGRVVELGVKAGVALGCKINEYSFMTRKNYVYPDLPKAYQITQGKTPICEDGMLCLPSGREIGIERIHIEEDAGRLKHEGGRVTVDYNRAGVPLIEIVTRPDFKSGDEVKEYLEMLTLIMKELNISDCKMQEGSLRCDINISLSGHERTEVKNVNSYSYAKKAVEYEIKRQSEIILSGGRPERETRRYSSEKNETVLMRKKEASADYRYFDEPDILPVYVNAAEAEKIKGEITLLPHEKLKRYIDMGIDREAAFAVVKAPLAAKYFDELCARTGDAAESLKIILSYVFKYAADDEVILPESLSVAEVMGKIKEGKISKAFSGRIFGEMFEKKKSFEVLFSEDDFAPMSEEEINALASEAIRENEKAVADYRAGKEKAFFSVMGCLMKKTGGKAEPEKVKRILLNILQIKN